MKTLLTVRAHALEGNSSHFVFCLSVCLSVFLSVTLSVCLSVADLEDGGLLAYSENKLEDDFVPFNLPLSNSVFSREKVK